MQFISNRTTLPIAGQLSAPSPFRANVFRYCPSSFVSGALNISSPLDMFCVSQSCFPPRLSFGRCAWIIIIKSTYSGSLFSPFRPQCLNYPLRAIRLTRNPPQVADITLSQTIYHSPIVTELIERTCSATLKLSSRIIATISIFPPPSSNSVSALLRY